MARLWIIGRSDLPAKDLKELIAWLKANPGKATAGIDRRRQRHATLLHRFPEQHRHQVPARAVSRRGSDHAGPAGRADRPDVPGGRADAGALPRRQDQGLCGDGHDALVRGARRADHRRGGRAGSAHDVLVRPVGAGRHAEGHRRQAQRRGGRRVRRSGGAGSGSPSRATTSRRATSSRPRRSARITRPRSRNGGRSSRPPASSCSEARTAAHDVYEADRASPRATRGIHPGGGHECDNGSA